ncbi:hypothetical protein ABEB36_008053 [Hypothenemus hampei]|uniref:Uncharacterized protein n=1 Tax=Hypothenemus hampei TaxID=57062 RepID=A0ABD1EL27_HYPHA
MMFSFLILSVYSIWSHCTISGQDSYMFEYVIDADGILSQQTEEKFNNIVRGSYSFLQPDGKIRMVRYKADPITGFRAHIKFRSLPYETKGPLKFPKDFQRPIRFVRPINTLLDLYHPSK